MNKKILIDAFCIRQFDKSNKQTTQIDSTVEIMEQYINSHYNPSNLKDGYAPFCKHLFYPNNTQSLISTIKITPQNEHLLKLK